MENIKKQIETIINKLSESNSIEDLDKLYIDTQTRINEGVEKMKVSNYFTGKEIEEITQYAVNTLAHCYNLTRNTIITRERNNWEF